MNTSGKVSISLSGALGLAAILFGPYDLGEHVKSKIQNPAEIGTPLLYLGILIIVIMLILIVAKAAS